MIEVKCDGAFSINCVGVERVPFPLSFSVRKAAGSWMISAAEAQAGELIDVLTRSSNDTVVIMDLATNSFLHEDFAPWRPSLIAADQGVDCIVHPVGAWASHTVGLGEEILVMQRTSLPRFLGGGWSPYELSLVDVPKAPTPAQLDEIALVIGTGTFDEPVLPRLKGARFRYSGHDDCYLAIEATDPTMPASILGRLLAGSALAGAGTASSVRVPEPVGPMVDRLIGESPHWIGAIGSASEAAVTIRLSALSQRWRLGQKPPEKGDYTATLDLVRSVWQLDPVGEAD